MYTEIAKIEFSDKPPFGIRQRITLLVKLFDGSTQVVTLGQGDTLTIVADVTLYNPTIKRSG